ncbi:P-loop containing nucleoside triphosphate hydrolase protein [Mycena galericulata]|nr:P-loop containing nucleoside triphosphate hydrolase protein [Mycena galericulata]
MDVHEIFRGRGQLLIPAYCTAISALVLLLRSVLSLKAVNGLLQRVGASKPPSSEIGKGTIIHLKVARLLGCLGLCAISVYRRSHALDNGRGDLMLMDLPYLYTTILAAFSFSSENAHRRIIRHVNLVLFATFCVYAYRDVLPLATLNGSPSDLDEGPALWAKVALLGVTSIVIPLVTPVSYIPVDPLNPMQVPNPEQTASILSFTFYSFLDPIIFLAYQKSELQEHELYPLCDTDYSAYLYLDKTRRHIFFGLMRVFRRDFALLAGLLVFRVVTNYASPVAMNQLLRYIETDGQGATVRPWVWIAAIFLGPVLRSLALQTSIFINTRVLVRLEALVTHLVFTHRQAETTSEKHSAGDFHAQDPSASGDGSDADSANETVDPGTSQNSSRLEEEPATVPVSSPDVKSKKRKEPAKPAKPEAKKSEGSMVGKINNLVTTDLTIIGDNRDFLELFISVPLQLAFGIWFLYVLLGWAVWVGVGSIILLTPVPGYMAKLVRSVQRERLKRTDGRVQSVSEAVNVLRMIKLFGWEGKMKERIGDKRKEELLWIQKRRFIELGASLINFIIPMTTMVVTYGTYLASDLILGSLATETLIMGRPLNASKVFASMTVFDILRDSIVQITRWLNTLMSAKVSLDRIDGYLKRTELLNAFDDNKASVDASGEEHEIGFRNATFSWSKESDGSLTRSERQFMLRIEGEVLFHRGGINLVVGPTGSGKTSLLMALLGEMHWIPSSPDSWYNLPRGAGVAYAAQESWVLNDTIRDNITFDTPFDEKRYKKVLYQCALEQDLALFQAGDQTEVGEKGLKLTLPTCLTLSGGQKARLTLARAVYSKADILLLDDVLAALDVHTAQWVVEKCFGGDLVEHRTVILVTHNLALVTPIAHFVVTFGSDGRIRSQGSVSEISKRGALATQTLKDQKVLNMNEEIDTKAPVSKPADGKLIMAEEVQLGHVTASALKLYLFSLSGHPFFFFVVFFGAMLFQQIFAALRTWILGYWASQYDIRPAEDVNVVFYLSVLVAVVFTSAAALAAAFIYLVSGQLRASKVIHKTLIDSVLRAPLRWLDVTPTSRITARVTSDVLAVDDGLPAQIWPFSEMISGMLVKFSAIVIYAPILFFPGVFVGAVGAWVGQIYIAGQLPVKRFMSNTRAPVLAHFGAAIAGLVSIRAFGAESKFNLESLSRIDRYSRAARNFYNLNRWVSVRVDMLGASFSGALAAYLVYIKPTTAGDAGFLINMAVTFTSMLLWVVRVVNRFEVQGNSLERIQGYIEIEHEKPATEQGKPPAYWPASGDLRVEHLSARYSENGPEILHDISFNIRSGERVGIVGRTGSGKSSLTLSLLRCIPTRGSMTYDGIETSQVNLDALRTSITIIPQVPELLSGTLRANLDPFGQYDDVELNSALRAAGLFALQNEMRQGRITLDSAISAGGGNLSVGQRQIFALARAIVRKSKILILDESTSAIDYKTDAIIQNTLRQELHDVSLLIIAHRLQTVMDADKIMVLDVGNIVEFNSPEELLKIPGGKFKALVDDSADKDALYAMANAN